MIQYVVREGTREEKWEIIYLFIFSSYFPPKGNFQGAKREERRGKKKKREFFFAVNLGK